MILLPAEKTAYRQRIEQELHANILPWWMNNAPDRVNGANHGFNGAVMEDGAIDNSQPRSVVLCARILWTFSAAYRAYADPAYLEMAQYAFTALTEYFLDQTYGGFYWTLDGDNQPINDRKQSYGQGFAIYGLSEYSLALQQAGKPQESQSALDLAKATFTLMETHVLDQQYGGYVESRSRDWGDQADMRLSDKELNLPKSMNTMLHMVEPYTNLVRAWKSEEPRAALRSALLAFLDHIVDPITHTTRLFFEMDWAPHSEIVSFGHDIEASWLLQEAAEVLGDEALIHRTRLLAVQMAHAAERGLDADGSLMYEAEGGAISLDEKYWWPQAEAMVGFYNAAQASPNAAEATHFAHISLRVWDYIDANMIDRVYGDWHKRLTRQNVPFAHNFKASAWDCPYHHVRACLEMMRRLGE